MTATDIERSRRQRLGRPRRMRQLPSMAQTKQRQFQSCYATKILSQHGISFDEIFACQIENPLNRTH
jgi:hypothetical protein